MIQLPVHGVPLLTSGGFTYNNSQHLHSTQASQGFRVGMITAETVFLLCACVYMYITMFFSVLCLGDEVLNFLTPTTTTNMITTRGINTTPATTRTTTTNTVKATNTIGNTADRDNDDNNVSYVPLIIALTVVVFVLVQVVVVTAVLLVFCHRLK